MFQQNVSKRTFELFFNACSISLCTLLPADWQYLHSSFVAIKGLNQKPIAHDLFYFFFLLFLKRPSPDASSSGRDFADLWLFLHDENHTSMTNINFWADFVDCYASIVFDHFPYLLRYLLALCLSLDVADATCFERIDVHWKTIYATQTLAFFITFHPQTVVAACVKFQWVLCS